jgi:hypothetical protein
MWQLGRPVMDLYALTGEHMSRDLPKALVNFSVSDEALKRHEKRVSDEFNFIKPEFRPVSADIRWWIVEKWHDGVLEKELQDCDTDRVLLSVIGAKNNPVTKYRDLPGITMSETWSGDPVKYVNGGYPGSKRTVTVNTQVGSVTASEEYASRSFGITEYPVKTIEDLYVVRYIYEQRSKYSTDPVEGCAPMTPIQSLLVHLAGVENTVYLLADYEEEVTDFLTFLEKIFEPVIRAIAKTSKGVFSVENYSSEVSGGYFERYLAPVLKERSRIAGEYGATIGVHHDGKLAPLIGRLKECGVGFINGITAAPSGDLEPEKIREVVGDGVVLMDIFPQAIFMPDFEEEDFITYVRRVAEFYKTEPGIIFGIGDMLPATGDIKRYEAMIKIVEEMTGIT